jgi:type II secretory pathway pseudopilin PulG
VSKRDRIVIGVVAGLALVVGSWLLVIQPKRDQASKLSSQVNAEQTQLDTVRTKVAAGQAAKNAYASSYTTLVKLGEAVPADDNVPSLIYQIQGAAQAAKVDFRDLTLSPGSANGAASLPTSSTSASQVATAAVPPGATVGPAGFPIEPFNFSFRGNFFHLANFFGRLQRFVVATNQRVSVSGRLMTLNAITLGPGPQGFPQITASISATTYLVPATQGLLNGATPTGPSSQPGTQPVSTPTSSTPTPTAVVATPVR